MGETTAAKRERQRRYYEAHREKINERNRRYDQANPAGMRERSRRYRASNAEAVKERDARYRAANPEAVKERSRQYRTSLRAAVFDHYGWACTCCGSTQRPTIDHKNGNGRQHRAELFGDDRNASTSMYKWIIANGFPADLQTLCRPCNTSKRDRPHCQINHQRSRPPEKTLVQPPAAPE
jgi:hypothetical protein